MIDDFPLLARSVEPPDNAVSQPARIHRGRECRVCSGPHDEEIHAATISVHRWFRDKVRRNFADSDLLTPAA